MDEAGSSDFELWHFTYLLERQEMKYRKFNRIEKKLDRRQKLQDAMKGEGLYVFENTTKSDLLLPKPLISGKRTVVAGEQFQGDSYYKSLLGSGLRLIRTITDAKMESAAVEQKLILDQPDRITHKGQVEHVVEQPTVKPLHEGQPHKEKQQDVLINEDPMSGIEIILN